MEFRLPELGEGVYEAEFVAWLVKSGDSVKRGQNLMEVLTDKATMEVPSPFVGTITGLHAEPGQQVKVGDTVLTYVPASKPDGTPEPEKGEVKRTLPSREARVQANDRIPSATTRRAPPSTAVSAAPWTVRAAPSVRYLARKLGLDLMHIRGTGPGGRILLEDLSARLQPKSTEVEETTAAPALDYGTPGTRIKLQGVRRKIAEHMVQSKRTIPHYTYVDECEVTDLVRLRDALRDSYAQAGVKLTYLAFFVKAVVAALKEIPIVNASLDESAGEIVVHDRYNIGIAVAAPCGLIVPVVHGANQKDLGQIAREVEKLSAEARAGKSKLEDLRGGTFTITSIGGIGGLMSTPVINYPEAAILGIGKVIKRPVYDNAGQIRPADLVYLSLSFDHRVVDGAVGAAFANAIIRRLQNPATLLLPDKLK